MTYEEAIQFWFGRVNYEQKTPQPDDLKLQHMRSLLARLGDPQDRLRILHVAGSKGKGSTSAMLAAMLQAAGYRTGLFTSPHLVAVEERMQVDRQPIARAELAALMAEMREASRVGGLERELTFFEVGTALGFLHFVRRRVDVAIVEVGLGGRFDSTNVCRPLAALITSISLDHTQVLGDTPEQIAREKAGIIKPGRPTVSGVRAAGPRGVIAETCRRRGSPLRQIDSDFRYTYEPALIGEQDERGSVAHVQTWRRAWPDLHLGLIGEHQARNAALAVAAIELLGELGLPVPEAAVRTGLATVRWPAPWRSSAGGRSRYWTAPTTSRRQRRCCKRCRRRFRCRPGAPATGVRRQPRQGPGRHAAGAGAGLRPHFPDALPRQPALPRRRSWPGCSRPPPWSPMLPKHGGRRRARRTSMT